ncbi:unnamed protein product [Prunus armeniaca]|uniref:Uncharacterized protein n=1 Tax=Prunus armeniaca TaxID=36596 RepID=A0A6J5V2L0_PRUAR|nr:unnamed protein product [Prunus armeniaca]
MEGSDLIQSVGCCAVPKLSSATVALNVHGTQDVILETFGSSRIIEEGVKLVEGSGVGTRNGKETFDSTMNMQGTRDENETLVSLREAADKQIKGIRVVEI